MLHYTGPDRSWAQALLRAERSMIRAWQRHTDTYDFFVFETSSSEEPALPIYTVAVKADVNGIHISCDCLAGTNGRICRHAARVLNVMGHLPSLPAGYDGGALASTWGHPAGPAIDGKTALQLLNGTD